MKYFVLKIGLATWELRGFKAKYQDGSTALELICLDPELRYEEVYARVTVALEVRHPLPPNCIWVKTWSENADMYEALIKGGYLEFASLTAKCGYSEAHACWITPKFLEFISEVPR